MNLEICDNAIINSIFAMILIFCARIVDVSIGTVRIILISKGFKRVAPIIGFFESFVWILAIAQIMQNLTNIFNYFAFAAGFATGTWTGMKIEEKLSIGKVALRVITRMEAYDLLDKLSDLKDISITSMDADGKYGHVKIFFMVVRRKQIPELIRLINEYNPKAFYTIEDVRFVNAELAHIKKPDHPSIFNPSNLRKAFIIKK